MYMPFYAACISAALGFLFFFLSFSSPYWLQSYDRVHSSFLHMGIWSVCFDKFVHPQDYHANVLTGCFWVYDRFFFKIGIWQWLNPYWLIGVQVLITIAFTAKCCVILILVLYHLLFGHPAAESTMALVGEVFIGILLTICILVFGISSQSRVWMPRPDQYFLSWSFGFIILAAICSFISSGFLYCISYTDRAAQEEVEKFEAVETNYGMPSVLSGRIGSGGLYSGGLSGIGGAGGVVVKVPSTGARPEQVIALDSDLRPMDTGHESMSLFSPSIGMLSNNPYHYKGIDKQPVNLNHQHHNESNSPTFSPVESEQYSQETPLYVNHPTTTKYMKQSNYSSSSVSSNMKSYSPLVGEEEEEANLSMLSENPDRRNTIIQRDNTSPSPIRHSLPTSQRGYHSNTRYSHY
uniref:PMP-22/EMP/MP20/Claudin tight junction n=2 Tax=Schistosoma mansoni TaxID=6183 RepID=A0A3Q0KNK9_SCHMA